MPNELTNPNNVVTEERLAQFYRQILPYLGGASHLCIGGGYAPIGAILPFMGTIVPGGFLSCDGSVYNIADYPALADFIDTQFGSIDFFGGDGLVTFAVPDLRGEFLRGTGTNSHTGEGNGSSVGKHQSGTVVPNVFFDDAVKNFAVPNIKSSGNTTPQNADSSKSSGGTGKGRYVYANGEWQGASTDLHAYTIRPTNTSVLYCIKAELDNTYSTTEKIVGTWIDGKPIWQKTISCTTPNAVNSMTSVADLSSLNIDTVCNMDGMFMDGSAGSAAHLPINYYLNANNYAMCHVSHSGSSHYLSMQIGLNDHKNKPAKITIQYTKTSS